nr:immunoglobulin light chain junction region [Macaca mulatta]MOV67611.1 immunoglobulin light chain junction region [Macaca mulatta]MOV68004.1 immunoglobulin light chain junction region [Macaca mulatta]
DYHCQVYDSSANVLF